MKAIVYSKEHCPYCTRAKSLLDKIGIPYEEYIIKMPDTTKLLSENQHWVTREELLEKAPNARTVPQIWIDGEHIGGYTELASRYHEPTATAV